MTRRIHGSGTESSMPAATLLVLAYFFVSVAAWPLEAASPAATKAAAATKRDAARCVTQADVDACNDAIRRNPSDPALLVALGDALIHAKRTADAVRYYRRAATLAPRMPDAAAKLNAAEKRLASERAPVPARRTVQPAPRAAADPQVARASSGMASGKPYSNAAPETQSH
jgi:cytochrome c-type biogenesis protein CcmH/NrfG